MSRLEELIQEYCPKGAKVYFLGELEDNNYIKLGRGNVISKNEIRNSPGEYPVYSSSITGDGEIGRYGKYMFDDERITWSIDGGGKFFYRNNIKYSVTNVGGWIKVLDDKFISTKYLYYSLINSWSTQEYNYIKKAHPSVIRNEYIIPVPPLPVQQEIVRILDSFTTLTAELEAELEARKKQYEFFRDELLETAGNGNIIRFGDIANIVRGASPRPIRNYVTTNQDGVNWIKIGDIQIGTKYVTETAEKITAEGAKKSRFVHPGDFILSNSMSFGRPYIVQIDGCIHDGWLSISGFNDVVTTDYLYHLLNSNVVQQQMKKKASFGGAVQNLNADIVKSLELKIPKIKEQEKIVSVLDRFDTLCNDISSGLPAEIEARKKQYEYYRDKLLTFKRLDGDE